MWSEFSMEKQAKILLSFLSIKQWYSKNFKKIYQIRFQVGPISTLANRVQPVISSLINFNFELFKKSFCALGYHGEFNNTGPL